MRPIVLQILACALIAAGALRPGERLATAAGAAVVEYVTVQPGERRVFNLSVEGDRRYLVGEAGTLVHNAQPCVGPNEFFKSPADAIGDLHGIAVKVGNAVTKNAQWREWGYTVTYYFRDSQNQKWTVFFNPKSRTYAGAHLSSSQD
jgi:hypothetical protein